MSDRPGRVGVDIGGTFTDVLLFDAEQRQFTIDKILTTPDAPASAVGEGVEAVLNSGKRSGSDVAQVIHGTTLVTNALIERRGSPSALITTRGFRDAVEMGREHRYDLYDIFLEMPKPLVRRRWRLELDERMAADGTVLKSVDRDEVKSLVDELREGGIEAVGVALLHSYRNPVHEREVGELLRELAPELTVTLSSDVAPEIREYERVSTTLANVYVRPLVDRYLGQLSEVLRNQGVVSELLIMLSSGGLCTVDTARAYPVRLVESGPAAGALAAARYGQELDLQNLLSFDMGGTTAKACLIENGAPTISTEFEVSRVYRFKKGSGLPVKVPVIEMIEIGAGGGSIASIDSLGLLKIGPQSAGSDPGPVCYGRGGELPTVTDADLVLGYLDPEFFLGGEMALNLEGARSAIAKHVAEPLGLDVMQAAWGMHQVVNENMANAARVHAVEQGKDPRRYPVFAFGGAGPVHAWSVGRVLGAPEVIVPLGAGVLSTVGFLSAPLAFDFVRSLNGLLDRMDWEELNRLFAEMEAEGNRVLANAGVATSEMRFRRLAELRYAGQGHEITIELGGDRFSSESVSDITARFEAEYARLYQRAAPGNPIEAVNWRLLVSGPSPQLPLELLSGGNTNFTLADAVKVERAIYLPESGDVARVPVYDRYRLVEGTEFRGPAIVEERESTAVINTDALVRVDELRNLRISRL
ncbi:MAG: hydantoinase/oxoprolinase family protein [Thermomicrobiaceae bacterium]